MENKTEILRTLKKLTTAEKADFSEAMNYFFDYIAENPPMFSDGELLKENTELYKTLLKPIAEYFGKEVEVSFLCLIKMNGADYFIHGTACLSNGAHVVLYFFRDINVGIAAASFFTSKKSDYFRLSAKIVTMPENASTYH